VRGPAATLLVTLTTPSSPLSSPSDLPPPIPSCTSCSSSAAGAVAVVEPTSMSTEVVTVKTEAGMGGEEVRVVRFLGVRGGAEGELHPSSSSFKARASSSSCLFLDVRLLASGILHMGHTLRAGFPLHSSQIM